MVKKNPVYLQVLTWIILALFMIPTLWFLMTSFKTRVDSFSNPPRFIFKPILDNYRAIFSDAGFIRKYGNSVIIAVTSCLLSMIIGLPAAYSLSAFNFKNKEDLAFWILSTRMAPPILVILPFYLFFRKIGLLNTRWAMIIVYTTFNLSFVVWMMKGYFESIPKSLEEAARIDGAHRLKAYISIVLPIASPGLAACMVFIFINSWNEYFYALILSGSRSQTVPVAINAFISLVGIRWGEVAAAGMIILIPVVLFGILVRKYLVSGLTMGAVK